MTSVRVVVYEEIVFQSFKLTVINSKVASEKVILKMASMMKVKTDQREIANLETPNRWLSKCSAGIPLANSFKSKTLVTINRILTQLHLSSRLIRVATT